MGTNTRDKKIIAFLKKYHENYETELFDLMDNSEQGVYFINEKEITFSKEAQRLLNVDETVTLDFFYSQINLQDRQNFLSLLSKKQNDNTPYEFVYRYKLNEDKIIWIKEHGIFSFSGKSKRIAIINDHTKQVVFENELHRMAYYDRITDLKNRNYFEQDIRFLHDYKIPFALYLLDINSFKVINDNFGHLYGDTVLKKFSEKLISCIESGTNYDLYRLSGDEFAIIFPYVGNKKESDVYLSNITNSFNQPMIIENHHLEITPSIGIAFYPKDSKNISTLIKMADLSMYKAKTESYFHYCYFDKKFYAAYKEEKAIEEYIRKAIENDLIELNYQPIYHITDKIVGFEALFNSNSPYNTEAIFSTAIKSHLIVLLEKYIIEKVFIDIKNNIDKLPKDLRFTINITPRTIEFIDVGKLIGEYLDKYEISSQQIGIEITEQYYISDENKLNLLIFRLQALGVKVYLDDFGMGYSSVRNLLFTTYDHIKIDKRLISSIFTNKKTEYFIKHIIEYAKEVSCKLIFEGIETIEQLNYLKEIGAEYIQGYYYSKPQAINQAIMLLDRSSV